MDELRGAFPHLSLVSIRAALEDCGNNADAAAAVLLGTPAFEEPEKLPPRIEASRHPGTLTSPPHAGPLIKGPFIEGTKPSTPVKAFGKGGARSTRKGVGADRQHALTALSGQFPWADVSLVKDVLFECGWDVTKGAALLRGMKEETEWGAPARGIQGPPGCPSDSPQDIQPGGPSGSSQGFQSGGPSEGYPPRSGHLDTCTPLKHRGPPSVLQEHGEAGEWDLSQHRDQALDWREGLNGSHGGEGSSHETEDVAQLLDIFPWADCDLLTDVLLASGGDLQQASEWLCAVETGEDEQKQGQEQEQELETKQEQGPRDRSAIGPRGPPSLPGAPRRVRGDDGVYRAFRTEALKATRDQKRHAKAAARAFDAGDHSGARQLSKLASGDRARAQALHKRAAEQILRWKDKGNRWELDLHGLHVAEALDALQMRIEQLERPSPGEHGQQQHQDHAPWTMQDHGLAVHVPGAWGPALVPGQQQPGGQQLLLSVSRVESHVRRELAVITGVGKHSIGGATIPNAVKSFLLGHGYQFRDSRPGVVSVKLHIPSIQTP